MNPGTARPDFAKIAAESGLTPKETEFFDLRSAVSGVDAGQQFNLAAFSLSPEVPFSDPVHGKDGYYVLEYVASKPSEIPTFEEVKDQVVDRMKRQRAFNATVKQGRELDTKVKAAVAAGKSFTDACASLGLKVKTSEPFAHDEETTNLPFESQAKSGQRDGDRDGHERGQRFRSDTAGWAVLPPQSNACRQSRKTPRRRRGNWKRSFLSGIARRCSRTGRIPSCVRNESITKPRRRRGHKRHPPKKRSLPGSPFRRARRSRRGGHRLPRHDFTNSRKASEIAETFSPAVRGGIARRSRIAHPVFSIASIIPSGARATTSNPRATRSTAWWWLVFTRSKPPIALFSLPLFVHSILWARASGFGLRWPSTCGISVPPSATFITWIPRQIPNTGWSRSASLRDT